MLLFYIYALWTCLFLIALKPDVTQFNWLSTSLIYVLSFFLHLWAIGHIGQLRLTVLFGLVHYHFPYLTRLTFSMLYRRFLWTCLILIALKPDEMSHSSTTVFLLHWPMYCHFSYIFEPSHTGQLGLCTMDWCITYTIISHISQGSPFLTPEQTSCHTAHLLQCPFYECLLYIQVHSMYHRTSSD